MRVVTLAQQLHELGDMFGRTEKEETDRND